MFRRDGKGLDRWKAIRTRETRRAWMAFAGLVLGAELARASGGSPQLAIFRATPHRSETTPSVTLEVEASFNFDDALQLPLPVEILVTQGSLTGRFDLAGNVFTSLAGGPEQPSPGLGLIAITRSVIVLVLPSAFSAGPAAVQLLVQYRDTPFASNRLDVDL